ncbi:MAG: serine hydrolase, partial [Solirubrobacteraceae bacterium]
MQKNIILIFIYSFFLFNCNNVIEEQQALILKNEPKIPKGISQPMYFPPNENNEWETISLDSLDWNQRVIEPLTYLLKQNKTKSFIILVDGKIVMEEYYDGYNPSSAIDWQSAYKSVIGSIAGIAQQEGLFSINDKVSDYLGNNWSKAPIEKEKQIK